MQTKNQIENQIQDFFNTVSKEDLTEIEIKLKVQYPGADDYWINYWAIRIAFFTNSQTDFNFKVTGDYGIIDPDTIGLSFNPDYGTC